MKKTMRGFVDPMTLGFLLSLLGASLAMHFNSDKTDANDTAALSAQTEQVSVATQDSADFE